MKNKEPVKATKDISAAIVAKMKEGYSQRKAISVAQIKAKPKKK